MVGTKLNTLAHCETRRIDEGLVGRIILHKFEGNYAVHTQVLDEQTGIARADSGSYLDNASDRAIGIWIERSAAFRRCSGEMVDEVKWPEMIA